MHNFIDVLLICSFSFLHIFDENSKQTCDLSRDRRLSKFEVESIAYKCV